MPPRLSNASSSDTTRVTAKLIPDVASVIPKRYTVITNWYTPTISEPIFLEIYAVKYMSIALKINDVIIRKEVLKMKNLKRFISHLKSIFLEYMKDIVKIEYSKIYFLSPQDIQAHNLLVDKNTKFWKAGIKSFIQKMSKSVESVITLCYNKKWLLQKVMQY